MISSCVLKLVVLGVFGFGFITFRLVCLFDGRVPIFGFVYGGFWRILSFWAGLFCFEWISGIWLVSGLTLFCGCSDGGLVDFGVLIRVWFV